VQRGLGVRDDIQRGGRAAFHDGEQRTTHAVQAHGVHLRVVAVVNLRDIAEPDGCAVDDLDWQIVQIINWSDGAVDANVVFRGTDFCGAAG